MLIGPLMLLVVVPALRMMFLGDQGDDRAAGPAVAAPDMTPAE
jgi:heavy metal efflux system protein